MKIENKYECHITLDNPYVHASIYELEYVGRTAGWHCSKISGDPLLGNKLYFYYTRHNNDYKKLEKDMNSLVNYLTDKYGIKPVRKKIEQILLDVRM